MRKGKRLGESLYVGWEDHGFTSKIPLDLLDERDFPPKTADLPYTERKGDDGDADY